MKNENRVQQHDDFLSDVVITHKNPERGLRIALTQCYVRWNKKGRKSLSAALKCDSVPADDEEFGPVFFKVGNRQNKHLTALIYVLFWRERIVISKSIEIIDGCINFKSADIYSPLRSHHSCPHCSPKKITWHLSGFTFDMLAPLAPTSIASIKDACDHWDELFCIGKNGDIGFKNGEDLQANDFEPDTSFVEPKVKIYGRNWSGFDYNDQLTTVSMVWPLPYRFD